jgi:signal transduction histidine kinase
MVVLNRELQILDANPAVAKLLRSPLDDLYRNRIDTAISSDTEFLETLHDELRGRGQWHGELELKRKDGSTVPIEASAVVVYLLSGPVYVWVWHDLTQQRALQQMQDNFVSSASHELRTPLTAALAALGLMQQPEIGELQPAHRELIDNAMRNVLRLRILVDDLLAQGEMQAQVLGLNCRPLDLRQVIAGAVEAVHTLLQRKGQYVELDGRELSR